MKQNSKNETELFGLISKIQEQITALDKKVDALMMRALVGSSAAPVFQKSIEKHVPVNKTPNEHHKGKVMHQAICADCKKDCSVPFQPREGRPIYCKECFSIRRNGGVKTALDKPKDAQPVQAMKEIISAPIVKEKKKPNTVKKAVAKKKPAPKKKKK